MKNLSMLAVAGLIMGSLAHASVFDWDRPIMGAKLNYVQANAPKFPRGTNLTINQKDGSDKPTSFTLTEDTGIRCIQAPCPTYRDTEFTITSVAPAFDSNSVRYEALEVLKNIPPNVRIAPRHLNVTESYMELVAPGGGGFTQRTIWDVELLTFGEPTQRYSGNPVKLLALAGE